MFLSYIYLLYFLKVFQYIKFYLYNYIVYLLLIIILAYLFLSKKETALRAVSLKYYLSHSWFATVQEVLQADWQEV